MHKSYYIIIKPANEILEFFVELKCRRNAVILLADIKLSMRIAWLNLWRQLLCVIRNAALSVKV